MTAQDGRVGELIERTDAFIRDLVIPREREAFAGHHGSLDSIVGELRAQARRLELIAPHLPRKWGGQGLTHLETARVFRAAGYSLLGPLAMNIAAPDEGNMHLLDCVGTEEQKARFLAPLAKGTVRSAFLMTEPDGGAGSDPSMLSTVAEEYAGEWIIRGRKTFATGAAGADFAIVMARTGSSATMFLVQMNTPGIRVERILDTLDETMPGGHAVVALEDVRIAGSDILGEANQGFRYAQVRLAPARLTHCMRWWGAARRAHDVAVSYAASRQAFGQFLLDHEGVGFMLADNLIELKQTELLIDWCAGILDTGAMGTTESSMVKVAASESLWRIADRCVQILGGLGVSRDTIVEQVFREMRAFRIYDGPSEVHRWSLARSIKREHSARLEGVNNRR